MVPDRDEAGPTSAATTYLSAPTGGSPRRRPLRQPERLLRQLPHDRLPGRRDPRPTAL